jgi:hypothetical protein
MDDTGYRSKTTISDALIYLRDELRILDWKPGHGNQFKHFANTYQFDQAAMIAALKDQKVTSPRRVLTDEST